MKNRTSIPGLLLILGGIILLVLAAAQAVQSSWFAGHPPESAAAFPTNTPHTVLAAASVTPIPTDLAATDEPPPPTAEQPTAAPSLAPALRPIPTLPPALALAPTGSRARPIRVVIPAIRVDARVVEMTWLIQSENGQQVAEWQVPRNEVGHAINSANPGERSNVVLSGHNNLYAAVFRKLYTLKPGDEIRVYSAAGLGYLYRVNESYIVPEAGQPPAQRLANASVLLPTNDARVTLTSCWPETSNTHRAIVIAMLEGALP